MQDGAAAVRHLLALCTSRDERDLRDSQHAFQEVLLNPEDSLHSFKKRFNPAAHDLKLSGVELTETEVADQYLFALNSLHQSSSNTSVVMCYFKHQDKRSLERAVDKEAPTELVLTELQWDLQNEQEHTRRFAPRQRRRANNTTTSRYSGQQSSRAYQRSSTSSRPPHQPMRGGRSSGRGQGRGGRQSGRGSSTASQESQSTPSGQPSGPMRCLGCLSENHTVMQCPTTSSEDARRLLDQFLRDRRSARAASSQQSQRSQAGGPSQSSNRTPRRANAVEVNASRQVAFLYHVESQQLDDGHLIANMDLVHVPQAVLDAERAVLSEEGSESSTSTSVPLPDLVPAPTGTDTRSRSPSPRVHTVQHDDHSSSSDDDSDSSVPSLLPRRHFGHHLDTASQATADTHPETATVLATMRDLDQRDTDSLPGTIVDAIQKV